MLDSILSFFGQPSLKVLTVRSKDKNYTNVHFYQKSNKVYLETPERMVDINYIYQGVNYIYFDAVPVNCVVKIPVLRSYKVLESAELVTVVVSENGTYTSSEDFFIEMQRYLGPGLDFFGNTPSIPDLFPTRFGANVLEEIPSDLVEVENPPDYSEYTLCNKYFVDSPDKIYRFITFTISGKKTILEV